MNIIDNPYNEKIVEFTTQSNMRVIVVSKPSFVNQAVGIGTAFGGLTTSVLLNQQEKHLQPGLAHFLEHQLFESELGNIMGEFTKCGANVNAFTSYHETVYYFSTTNPLKKPMHLLMDMVNDVSISEASTKKEKGIILQELSMYDQMPEAMLLKQTFANLYREHPMKNDIGGSKESVQNITHDDLIQAYNLFYHPSQLTMVIVSFEDVDVIKQWIENHPLASKNTQKMDIKPMVVKETFDHLPQSFSMNMDVSQNKVTVALPITSFASTSKARLKQQWAIKVLLESHFSEINDDYQRWMDQGIINELFDYDVDIEEDYGHVLFLFENIKKEEANNFVLEQLQKLTVNKQALEQMKRRWIFSSLRVFNRPSSIMTQLLHYSLKNDSYFDVIDAIESLTLEDLQQAKDNLETLTSVVEVTKKNELD